MKTALIGCTGFVGSTLRRSTSFDDGFHSTDINRIDGNSYDLIVSAAAPAKKWLANQKGLQPYGYNRRRLEIFVREHFELSLIVRLPGLVGPGLRKNIIYDFLNHNNLDRIDSRHVFQFYPMVNLWTDIQKALKSGLNLVHLTAEPVSVAEVARVGFGQNFTQIIDGVTPVRYDFRTLYANLWGREGGAYQYSREDSLRAICDYAETEKRTM